MGTALQDEGNLDKAIEAYKKAISIKPDFAQAWCNCADALEKWNKIEQLEIMLKDAYNSFEIVPNDLVLMKCKLLWRTKRFEETYSLISSIHFETIPENRRQDYLQLKAKCFDKFKRFDDAFEYFARSNVMAKKSQDYSRSNPDRYFQILKKKLRKLKSKPLITSTTKIIGKSDFEPTFLVGFPRSGTTLLDTILRSNSTINIVEEQPILQATESFLNKNGIYNFEVQLIPAKLLHEAREIYKRGFKQYFDISLAELTFIDKLPLSLLDAPLIYQLFPYSKFILALRHPMDTILSCWMQNFKLNPAMANMVDLDRIVDFYCLGMETFKICRHEYKLNVHEIRYEDLIGDFQKETKTVLRFLDLQWEPEMKNYQDTALKRERIYTPSYSQVVEPIYKDAQYRWLNYEKYLDKYLDKVSPWIAEFGYN